MVPEEELLLEELELLPEELVLLEEEVIPLDEEEVVGDADPAAVERAERVRLARALGTWRRSTCGWCHP